MSTPELTPSIATVSVLLQPLLLLGPAAPCPRLEVLASETPTTLRVWLRRALGLGPGVPIYLTLSYGGRRCSPSPDECLGSLATCFSVGGVLIIGYSTRQIGNN
jgi:hypothetical protein